VNVSKMVVNIAGVVTLAVFYCIILLTGIWASRKSSREEKKCQGGKSEVAMVGGRDINVLVGVFTMTGEPVIICLVVSLA